MRMIFRVLVALSSTAVSLGAVAGLSDLAQAENYTVGVHALKIASAMETAVLTNSGGMSLYYYTADTPTKSRCSGACAKTWRALISNAPTKDPKIRGKVAVVRDVHGAQVSYNGHLLYTYAGDKAPGTAMGYGLAGKWFVATPSLARW